MKNRILFIILSLFTFILISGCSTEQNINNDVDKTGVAELTKTINKVGNTNGNIMNGGIVAKQGDWIYFRTENGICRSNLDGTEKFIITKDEGYYLNVLGEWLYYKGKKGIYKARIDGTEVKRLDKNIPQEMIVVGEWIYYINESDNNKIYKMKTDGSGKINLNNDESNALNILEESLYYINESDDNFIYKININGTSRDKVSNNRASVHMIVDYNGSVYYRDYEEAYQYINKINAGSLTNKRLNDDQFWNINFANDCIYYSLYMTEENNYKPKNIYKINNEGDKILITSDLINSIFVFPGCEWIYYIGMEQPEDDEKIYRIKIDGTGKQMVE